MLRGGGLLKQLRGSRQGDVIWMLIKAYIRWSVTMYLFAELMCFLAVLEHLSFENLAKKFRGFVENI